MIEYRKVHYLLHKKYYLDKAHSRKIILKNERAKFIRNYFLNHPCVDCGISNPVVLEFDHKNSEKKEFNVGSILYSSSMTKIMNEINKCEVRCSNCHRIKTAKQNGWLKGIDV